MGVFYSSSPAAGRYFDVTVPQTLKLRAQKGKTIIPTIKLADVEPNGVSESHLVA